MKGGREHEETLWIRGDKNTAPQVFGKGDPQNAQDPPCLSTGCSQDPNAARWGGRDVL
jgi:hypothetical protein